MRIDDQLKMICVKNNISLAEIARRLNKTPQAFSQKMKRGNFTLDDLNEIALVSGCKVQCAFIFPDGDKVVIERGEHYD